MEKNKSDLLKLLLGGGDQAEALVDDLIDQADTVQKMAKRAGIVYKARRPAPADEYEAIAADVVNNFPAGPFGKGK